MAYNGSGSYSPPSSSFPAVSGALIESAKFNNIVNDIASALSTAICKDGQTTVTANLPMAGYRHTGVGGAITRAEYAAAGQVQDSSFTWAGTAGGTANDITLTLSPAPAAYAAGQSFTYKSGASANTSAMTVNINGLGAKAIQKNGATLSSGDHPANSWFRIIYDGSAFQMDALYRQATTSVSGVAPLATGPESQAGVDNTKIITPAALGLTVPGMGQTWQNMTASRSSSTVYTNSTGRPIMVSVALLTSVGSTIFITVAGNTFYGSSFPSSGGTTYSSFIVPNGATYSVANNLGTSVVSNWAELR